MGRVDSGAWLFWEDGRAPRVGVLSPCLVQELSLAPPHAPLLAQPLTWEVVTCWLSGAPLMMRWEPPSVKCTWPQRGLYMHGRCSQQPPFAQGWRPRVASHIKEQQQALLHSPPLLLAHCQRPPGVGMSAAGISPGLAESVATV